MKGLAIYIIGPVVALLCAMSAVIWMTYYQRPQVQPMHVIPSEIAHRNDIKSAHNIMMKPQHEHRRIYNQRIECNRGDTMYSLLRRSGMTKSQSYSLIKEIGNVYNVAHVRSGQYILRDNIGDLYFYISASNRIHVHKISDAKFSAKKEFVKLHKQIFRASGNVKSNLFSSVLHVGMSEKLVMKLVNLYSNSIDVKHDMRANVHFDVLFERFFDNAGDFVHDGGILYAELRFGKKKYAVYRYVTGGGKKGYFDDHGMSVSNEFLRFPVEGGRISSRFGMREHPILGYARMHRGVDFAAPEGTRVYATASGIVKFIGWRNGYGNLIAIHHNSHYTMLYGHMRGFHNNMMHGGYVHRGDVIGYVGSTGMTTGPNLHYEILKNRSNVDPLSVTVTSMRKLNGIDMELFNSQQRAIRHILVAAPIVNVSNTRVT